MPSQNITRKQRVIYRLSCEVRRLEAKRLYYRGLIRKILSDWRFGVVEGDGRG